MNILNSIKRQLYKSGLFEVKIPKGDTSKWTVNDWINYIDENGTWTV